jgi:soluble lytic murein transglycosylase-like protein
MVMRPTVIALLVSAFSAQAASGAVEVRFVSGQTMIVEAVEMRDGQAVLTLSGGGTLALSAKRIESYREVPAAESTSAAPGQAPEARAPASPGADTVETAPEGGIAGADGTAIAPAVTAPRDATTSSPESRPFAIPDLIQEASGRYGVDAELLRCLIEVESGYDPLAVSPKGAMGLGQLMPGTAKDLGVSNPFDPAEAVDAAARHLSELLRRSGGRFVPALAAYNAGQGAVNRYGGVPPYRETIRYIEKILERYATK